MQCLWSLTFAVLCLPTEQKHIQKTSFQHLCRCWNEFHWRARITFFFLSIFRHQVVSKWLVTGLKIQVFTMLMVEIISLLTELIVFQNQSCYDATFYSMQQKLQRGCELLTLTSVACTLAGELFISFIICHVFVLKPWNISLPDGGRVTKVHD